MDMSTFFTSQPDSTRLVGVVGDWHGDTGWGVRVVDKLADENITHIFQLGDFGVWQDNNGRKYLHRLQQKLQANNQHLWVTLGNHENYELVAGYPFDEFGTQVPNGHDRIHLLPRVHQFTIGGRNILSLGGAASIDYDRRRQGIDWFMDEQITAKNIGEVRESVEAYGHPEVMFTHEAPKGAQPIGAGSERFWSRAGLRYANQSATMMRHAVDLAKPGMLWHGHYHTFQDSLYTFPVDDESGESTYQTRVICLDMNGQREHTTAVLDLESLTYEFVQILKPLPTSF